jgi:hypothetical protein
VLTPGSKATLNKAPIFDDEARIVSQCESIDVFERNSGQSGTHYCAAAHAARLAGALMP